MASKKEIEDAFRMFDLNKDGEVTVREVSYFNDDLCQTKNHEALHLYYFLQYFCALTFSRQPV